MLLSCNQTTIYFISLKSLAKEHTIDELLFFYIRFRNRDFLNHRKQFGSREVDIKVKKMLFEVHSKIRNSLFKTILL